ncbi:hypothetical protein VUR80DRAFT_9107 [Thermomyces stellatus]
MSRQKPVISTVHADHDGSRVPSCIRPDVMMSAKPVVGYKGQRYNGSFQEASRTRSVPAWGSRGSVAEAPWPLPPTFTDPSQSDRGSTDKRANNGAPHIGGYLFHRRSSASSSDPEDPGRRSSNRHSRGGLFHRRSSLSRGGGGLLRRDDHEDPSIGAARERLTGAERAEEEAGRAVMQARDAVHEAREHVRRLEDEAKEESRLAKIKQDTAKNLGKRSKPLGLY